MPEYTLYNATTGAITSRIFVSEQDLNINIPEGQQYIPGYYDALEYYISNGVPLKKQKMNVTISGNTISGLPIPSVATIEGQSYTITDGVMILDTTMPGPYKVHLSSVPYLDYEVTIS